MKALSIQQPWAWLIVNGHKDIENRTWRHAYRGPVLIHAGLKHDKDAAEFIVEDVGFRFLPKAEFMDHGGIVGIAEIVDCVTDHASPWFFGPFGFVIQNARPLPFRPMKGQLGFF